MKVLILGAYGMLGHKLFSCLRKKYDVQATSRIKKNIGNTQMVVEKIIDGVDAFDFDSVTAAIEQDKPDIVINCIGLIKQLGSSSDPVSMMYLNSVFPHKLANIANSNNARVIHFSTDCIFSGKKGMYKISDPSDAIDLYGKTKYLGELPYKNSLTIRSSIIGPELGTKNGLFEWFLNQRDKTIKGYKNAIYSGFTTHEMANIISMVIDHYPDLHGAWQVASTPISKFDLLSMVNEKMNLGITIEPDYSFICDRSLDGSEFNKVTGYTPPSWSNMIDDMIMDMRD